LQELEPYYYIALLANFELNGGKPLLTLKKSFLRTTLGLFIVEYISAKSLNFHPMYAANLVNSIVVLTSNQPDFSVSKPFLKVYLVNIICKIPLYHKFKMELRLLKLDLYKSSKEKKRKPP